MNAEQGSGFLRPISRFSRLRPHRAKIRPFSRCRDPDRARKTGSKIGPEIGSKNATVDWSVRRVKHREIFVAIQSCENDVV
ncbi:hypothetical protein [Novipirellula caenicola]|uniref:hypothetical protein n=1 Tax=Novipirellula caenicola TaxID=1536901 RepID=UPI0031EFB347